MLFHNTERERE